MFSYELILNRKNEEKYNSDRDCFSDRSLYDQRILLKLVTFKWNSLVVLGRPSMVLLHKNPDRYEIKKRARYDV